MPPSTQKCNDPARCELSPEIRNALERFSLPHKCQFVEAKRLLVDKIVGTVLDNTSSSITAVLQNELEKWGSETKARRSG
ncbi:hypothetical protein QBC45DRAFT_85161 [Copromyces sp. CBS 386.78]|nr:hypothetical protein QBC45DRAFT_85161 [Copromyces sp. CBS 386.78]